MSIEKTNAIPKLAAKEASREMRVLMMIMVLKEPTLDNIVKALGLTRRTIVHLKDHLCRKPPEGYGIDLLPGQVGNRKKNSTKPSGYTIQGYGVFDEQQLKEAASIALETWGQTLREHGLELKDLSEK